MEKSATLGKSVAKAVAGALIGAVVGYGVTHLTGLGGGSIFAIIGSFIGAGMALGLSDADRDPFAGLDADTNRAMDELREIDEDRIAGRGIYVEDDV